MATLRISTVQLHLLCGLLASAIYCQAGFAKENPTSAAAARLAQTLEIELTAAPMRADPEWSRPQKVTVYLPPDLVDARPELLRELEQITAGMDLTLIPRDLGGRTEAEAVVDTQVFLGWCDPDLVIAAKALRYLHSYSAGVDQCALSTEVGEREFVLTNSQKVSGPPMAEHAIALMFALTRNLPVFHAAQAEGKWDRSGARNPGMTMITGKSMLILGLGGIGKEVARRANALGMRVKATRNSSRDGPDYVEYVGLSDEQFKLAGDADVIVNTLPLTKATSGMINKQFFAAMKPGAYYINVGRGATTVTEDMIAALKSGHVAGLGLDVTDPEPLPPEHELWTLRNVIITPHISTTSDIGSEYRWILGLENLRRYVNGDRLYNPVDLKRGY